MIHNIKMSRDLFFPPVSTLQLHLIWQQLSREAAAAYGRAVNDLVLSVGHTTPTMPSGTLTFGLLLHLLGL